MKSGVNISLVRPDVLGVSCSYSLNNFNDLTEKTESKWKSTSSDSSDSKEEFISLNVVEHSC